MNWGSWIIVSFVLFALFIGVLSAICMREDVSLVSKDYYQEELEYENQIQRINNTAELKEKPMVQVRDHIMEIQFSSTQLPEHGTVNLFRPSNSNFDQHFAFQFKTTPIQKFNLTSSPGGMYRVKIQWTAAGKDYYLDKMINL